MGAMIAFNMLAGMFGADQSSPTVFLAGLVVAIAVARYAMKRKV
jgi:hypothetical protein